MCIKSIWIDTVDWSCYYCFFNNFYSRVRANLSSGNYENYLFPENNESV